MPRMPHPLRADSGAPQSEKNFLTHRHPCRPTIAEPFSCNKAIRATNGTPPSVVGLWFQQIMPQRRTADGRTELSRACSAVAGKSRRLLLGHSWADDFVTGGLLVLHGKNSILPACFHYLIDRFELCFEGRWEKERTQIKSWARTRTRAKNMCQGSGTAMTYGMPDTTTT